MHPYNDGNNDDDNDNSVDTANIANASHPADFLEEFRAIQAESLGWIPLEQGVYLHYADQTDAGKVAVVQVVGLADASMGDSHVLWLVF